MEIIETSIFTKQVNKILSDDEYRLLQNLLILKPDLGKIIPDSGGLRKVRWSGVGKGKRGGSRIIYYWFKNKRIILMLLIYKKSESGDLTKEQVKVLRKVVEKELR